MKKTAISDQVVIGTVSFLIFAILLLAAPPHGLAEGTEGPDTVPADAIRVEPRAAASFSAFFGFHLDTTFTDTPYDANTGEYSGNVVYFPDTSDSITGSLVAAIWSMTPGDGTLTLFVPPDRTYAAATIPQLSVWDNTHSYSPEELSQRGYSIGLKYSIDEGITFSTEPPSALQDIDAIRITLSKATGATTIESNQNTLWVVADFGIAAAPDTVINGDVPSKGWKYVTPRGTTYSSPVGIFASSPLASGTIRQQDIQVGNTPDWENAGPYANARVELTDGENAVLGATLSDEQGNFSFNELPSTADLFVRVRSTTVPVYFLENGGFIETDSVPIGNVSDITRTFRTLPGVSWKNEEVNPASARSDALFFLVPVDTSPDVEPESPDVETESPDNETTRPEEDRHIALARVGDPIAMPLIIGLALSAIAIAAYPIVRRLRDEA